MTVERQGGAELERVVLFLKKNVSTTERRKKEGDPKVKCSYK